jgi:hypothetical protein
MTDVTKAVETAAIGNEPIKTAGAKIVASVMQYRNDRIKTLRVHLDESVDRLYLERNMRTRKALCDDINYTIDRIDELLVKNIDDIIGYEQAVMAAADQQKVETPCCGDGTLYYIQ